MKNNQKIAIDLEDDISEEMALELSDMLSVALHFAGVKEAFLQEAMEAYLKALDDYDEDMEYGREAMIAIIEGLQKSHKEFFV